jgi:hypothetical protein
MSCRSCNFACCNRGLDVFLPLQVLVGVQRRHPAEAQRPMHNSEFDQEQGTLDSANLRADLAPIKYSAMRGEVNGDAIVDC